MNLGVVFSCQGYEENLPVENEQPTKVEWIQSILSQMKKPFEGGRNFSVPNATIWLRYR